MGTKYGNIFEINEKTSSIQSLIKGHSEGELWGLAVHPNKEVFATASYDGFLKFWDVRTKVCLSDFTYGPRFLYIYKGNSNSCLQRLIKEHNVGEEIRCVDFSSEGSFVAIGSNQGEIVLYKVSNDFSTIEKIDSNRQRKACITDIK